MGWKEVYNHQQQAKQLRAIEQATAAQAGLQPRKVTKTEKYVLGVKDAKMPPATPAVPPPPAPPVSDRVAQLEAQVAALEARVQWCIDRLVEAQDSNSIPE